MAKKNATPASTPETFDENGTPIDTAKEFAPAAPMENAFDLAEKFPVWSAKKTPKIPLKGRLLGTMNLPSSQPNQEFWRCFVFMTTAATKVTETNDDGEETPRIAEPGEYVLVTATAVLKRLENAAADRGACWEVFLMPGGTQKTKDGSGTVQLFSAIQVGNPVRRTAKLTLPSSPAMRELPSQAFSNDEDGTPF